MQPNVTEQLAGIRRILEEVIAPAIGDEYVVSQLRAMTQTLTLLEGHWQRALPLLMQENDELGALFAEIRPQLAAAAGSLEGNPLAARITSAASQAPDRPRDYPCFSQIEAKNKELRALLAELIEAFDAAPSNPELEVLRAKIRDRLRTGLERALA
jgi:hypothetical protein